MNILDLIRTALLGSQWFTLTYFLVINTFYLVLLICAAWEMKKHSNEVRSENLSRLLSSKIAFSVSVLAPAYNEALTITESVRSLLALYYQNLEVIVINDGSPDETLNVLFENFDLKPMQIMHQKFIHSNDVRGTYKSEKFPNLVVVDKVNGGKADALNAGLNFASGDLVCAIDADTIIEPDAIQRMVRPFLQDGNVVAAGGTIRPVNGLQVELGNVGEVRSPRNPIVGFQALEYLRAFLFGRLGWNRLGGNLIISGAFGLFRRDAVMSAGGYLHSTVGEDMELVINLRKNGYKTGGPNRVDFIPDPVAWTEVPETARVLGKQRDRWHRGLADVLWRHRGTMFNPRYGSLGLVAYPYFLFVELLAPVVELFGVVGLIVSLLLGVVDTKFAILLLLSAYGYGLLLTAFTVALDEINYHRYEKTSDRVLLFVWSLLENLGYRQITVLWRFKGIVKYLLGKKDWGKMERRGFSNT